MSTPIPPPLRAVAGLAAVAIDNARKLPEQLVGLPVLAVSAALQVSLKAQQRYAALVARGDEVLGQLRPAEEAPAWARFDDAPSGSYGSGRPLSAFDTAVAPEAAEDALLDELAAEQLGGGEPETTRYADAARGGGTATGNGAGTWAGGGTWDTAAVVEPDGVAATEAEVGGIDVAEVPLDDELAPAADLPAGSVTGTPADLGTGRRLDRPRHAAKRATGASVGREVGAGTEPGVDLPAGHAGDAEETEAALAAAAAGREPGSVGEPGVDLPAGLAAGAEAVGEVLATGHPVDTDAGAGDPAAGLDGYLAVEPPIPHYDELSIPQLRGRLRSLTERQLADLIAYERSTAARPPYLTMLENRLATVRSR